MNTPQEIQALIQYAEEQYEAKMAADKQALVAMQQAEFEARKEQTHELHQEALPLIPDVLRPFVKLDDVDTKSSEYDLFWYERALEIHVPGLAPFLMAFSKPKDVLKISGWIVSAIRETNWDENFDLCKTVEFSWLRALRFEEDRLLYEVLREAKSVAEELPRRQALLDQRWGQASRRIVAQEKRAEQKQVEETAMFKLLQNDPVAAALLKAYLLIQQKREEFREIILQSE